MGPCTDWKQYVRWVQTAEELGFDSYWLPDHPALVSDCWAMLSALAVTTSRIRLGTLVDCVFYRNPVVLARTAADVDRLSGGRLILGLGMGDLPFEFGQMGIPYLSTLKRLEALEETIQIVRGLWGSSPFTLQGKHMQVEQCFLPVGPVQQPYVPLLIAGGGERVTLRQVAQYADASNFGPHPSTGSAFSTEDVVRKCNVLRAHCATAGRPEDAVLRTHITIPLVMGETREAIAVKQDAVPAYLRDPFRSSEMAMYPSEAIAYYTTLVQAGIQYFIATLWQNDLETLHMLAQQVLPALLAET
jgi:alkanesulfonate monooxygenase SsuD/methylene tetrahydromethanopterin reductase-like flavin-dependent oxidoreductase (luciferase family)